jgi:hypothetical protein
VNRLLALVIAPVALATSLLAQLSVGLVLQQDQFLPGESLPVSVRMTNFSGQTLKLGTDNDWLQFVIEAKSGYPVPRTSDVPVKNEFELETSTIATKHVDIGPHFETLKPGRYSVSAIVRIEQWKSQLATKPKEFDVINATVLWEQPFGLPASDAQSRPPEVRRYALQQAIHLKQMKLYVRVTDDSGFRIFGIFPLGPMLTFSTPEKQIDKESRLHVLYQDGARSFNYSIISPDGKWVSRQTHEYQSASRPVLRAAEDGTIYVRGGIRRLARTDLPPPPPESEVDLTAATNTLSAPTNAVTPANK